jgi:hypothetical protein
MQENDQRSDAAVGIVNPYPVNICKRMLDHFPPHYEYLRRQPA